MHKVTITREWKGKAWTASAYISHGCEVHLEFVEIIEPPGWLRRVLRLKPRVTLAANVRVSRSDWVANIVTHRVKLTPGREAAP